MLGGSEAAVTAAFVLMFLKYRFQKPINQQGDLIMKKTFFLILIFFILFSGCASTGKSVALGAASGAIGGSANGALLFPINRSKGVLRGALIGGVIGGIMGFATHKYLEDRDKTVRRNTILNLTSHDVLNAPVRINARKGGTPGLTKPIVEMEWVEPTIEGKKWIEGHKVWSISEEPQWVYPQDKAKEVKIEK